MIIIKLTGGLGNQLFQYAFGRYLSMRFNTELKIDAQTKGNSHSFTNRSIGIYNFSINAKLATQTEIKQFKYFSKGVFERLERKILQKVPIINKKYLVQSSHVFDFNMKYIRDNCYYDGYWQSEKYFKPIESMIREEFDYKRILCDENSELLKDILKRESISIHIRRGDYLSIKTNSELFSICSMEYYIKAIDYFLDICKNPYFYIFSDDIDWAMSNFKGEQFRIIDNNLNNPEIDLFLMSKCKHNVIANSSFSWWGAWLNANPSKVVIAPKKWYNGELNDESTDLIPSEWMKM